MVLQLQFLKNKRQFLLKANIEIFRSKKQTTKIRKYFLTIFLNSES